MVASPNFAGDAVFSLVWSGRGSCGTTGSNLDGIDPIDAERAEAAGGDYLEVTPPRPF